MGLETGTWINDLVSTNPDGTDQRSTADDHLRLIKTVLLNSFPNISSEVSATPAQINQLTTRNLADFSASGAEFVNIVATRADINSASIGTLTNDQITTRRLIAGSATIGTLVSARIDSDSASFGLATLASLIASNGDYTTATSGCAYKIGRSDTQYISLHGAAGGNFLSSLSSASNPKHFLIKVSPSSGDSEQVYQFYHNTAQLDIGGNRALTVADEGSGNGLDADTLDSIHGSSFLRSDVADTKTSGDLTFNDNVDINFGGGSDVEMFFNGADFITDLNGAGNDWFIRDQTTNRYLFDKDEGDFHADGDIIAFSTSVGSDPKLKDHITPIDNALESLLSLNGYTFTWKKNGDESAGLLSTDVREVLPQAVKTRLDLHGGYYDSVNYNAVVGLLVEAIKELAEQVKELRDGAAK